MGSSGRCAVLPMRGEFGPGGAVHLNRRRLLWILLGVTVWLAWTHVRDSLETVTLFARGLHDDHYVQLWVVDQGPYTWVRAERPDRSWLDALRQRPNTTMWRNGQEMEVRAVVWEGDGGAEHVDKLFRAKYGVLDVVAGYFWHRDSVPVRIERR